MYLKLSIICQPYFNKKKEKKEKQWVLAWADWVGTCTCQAEARGLEDFGVPVDSVWQRQREGVQMKLRPGIRAAPASGRPSMLILSNATFPKIIPPAQADTRKNTHSVPLCY